MTRFHSVSREQFFDLAYHRERELFALVDAFDVVIVRRMYDPGELRAMRDTAFEWGLATEPSWRPCLDGCPDYHRLHDNYPKAHVKSRMHAFYRHGFYDDNAALMAYFGEIFALKCHLAGAPPGSFIRNKPSDGPIARVIIHHYPCGGGGQAEHVDPVSPFARIQTLVMASQIGVDYRTGGLYTRVIPQSDPCFIDQRTTLGDMVVLSPGVQHGVAAVDPDEEYSWRENRGRWMILPIIINSDYPRPENVKPREVP
jgi:hypothetical protein